MPPTVIDANLSVAVMKGSIFVNRNLVLPLITSIALAITSSSIAYADSTIHLDPFQGSGNGPDRVSAHDNAFAQADSSLRAICRADAPAGTTGVLENENEDSTTYALNFPYPGWNALTMVEADCAFVSD